MELTKEQSAAFTIDPDAMLKLVDPATKREYVLLAEEVMRRIQEAADDGVHARGWQKAVQRGMALAVSGEE